jgi:phage portal protein BeeE
MLNRLKSLLRPPEQKASRIARLIALESGGRARWTPRDYAALAREGYVRNAVVYRAVRLIAESVGSLCYVLYEGAAERDTHPLLDLIRRPNPRQDGASFLEASPRIFFWPAMPMSRQWASAARAAHTIIICRCESSTRCGPTA